jgi:epoxyqueuosine reductase
VDAAELKAALIARAAELGFDAVRVTKAELAPEIGRGFEAYLGHGFHGGMEWLARQPERRADPRGLWPDARSVVVLATNYAPAQDPLDTLSRRSEAAISVYAQGDDYHDLVKRRLKTLARWLHAATGREVKVFVDTAPVLEKPLAARAGIGWQGKHTNLVSRRFGSWLLLGEIFSASEIEPDTAETDHCGACRRCLDICPTSAFPAPYRLDARRCISYLTIEHKGPIPAEFRAAIGNRIYGCDDCLAVCPWNKFASTTGELAFQPRAALVGARLDALSRLDDAQFRQVFAGSPIKRIGRDRFVRNVLVAIGNSADIALAESAERRLEDPSPLVRGMAVWALARLAPSLLDGWRARAAAESDPDVLAEWRDASV